MKMGKEVENKYGDLPEIVFGGITTFQYSKYEASVFLIQNSLTPCVGEEAISKSPSTHHGQTFAVTKQSPPLPPSVLQGQQPI